MHLDAQFLHCQQAAPSPWLTLGNAGSVLRADVLGKIMVRAQLSDMPELRLGLVNAEVTQDATFHQ
jgi:hypothetical protein